MTTPTLTIREAEASAPVPVVSARKVRGGRELPTGTRWWRELGWRHVFGVLILAFMLFPVLYVLAASLNPLGSIGGTTLVPKSLTFDHYATLLEGKKYPFGRWYANTLLLSLGVAVAQVACSTMAAYSFSRFRFHGRRGGLLAILLIQMFPQFLSAVALFTMVAEFGRLAPAVGLNTLLGYALVLMGGALGNVWLIKGFFDTVPKDLDSAAKIDGAGHFVVFTQIILPLVRPALAVTFLLSFIHVIGEYMLAAIFLTDNTVKTLAIGLFGIIEGDDGANLGLFSAGSVMICVPVVALFLYLQRFITGGLTSGAVK